MDLLTETEERLMHLLRRVLASFKAYRTHETCVKASIWTGYFYTYESEQEHILFRCNLRCTKEYSFTNGMMLNIREEMSSAVIILKDLNESHQFAIPTRMFYNEVQQSSVDPFPEDELLDRIIDLIEEFQ